jgi:hypothetical protein
LATSLSGHFFGLLFFGPAKKSDSAFRPKAPQAILQVSAQPNSTADQSRHHASCIKTKK